MLYGLSVDGLSDTGNQLWHQDGVQVPEDIETGDAFGAALSP